MYTHWLHFYCFNDTSHYGTGITHASTIYWSLFPEPVIRHDSGLSDACFLLLPTLKASSKYPLLHWLIILEIKWKSHIQYQLIQPVNTAWQSRENNLQVSNNTTHQVNNTSKSQVSSGLLWKCSPPDLTIARNQSPEPAHVGYSCPFAFSEAGREMWFLQTLAQCSGE